MRSSMARCCLLIAGMAVSCKINSVDQKGPPLTITAVNAVNTVGNGDPIFCNTAAGVVRISGTGLAPVPRDLLTDTPTLEHAHVTLVCGGVTTELGEVAYHFDSDSLTAAVPQGLAVGTCDVTVESPTGEQVTLPAGLEVSATCLRIDLCNSVDPAYGWIGGRTTIEICADNGAGRGLLPVPQVFLLVDADGDGLGVTEVPLIREAFTIEHSSVHGFADASVMTAVVPASTEPRGAGIVVGGPYDIRVVNPDGGEGIIVDAFEVLADPPPKITAVSPEQADTQDDVELTIDGESFKTTARVMLLRADQASGAACTAPNCYLCGTLVVGSALQATCMAPSSTMSSGSYVVRFEHTDDGSFSDFSAFAVTNPAGNLAQSTTALPALGTGRYAHAAISARDDSGNRFVYAIGGRNTTALDTVEVAALSRFGQLGSWRTLTTRLPRATAEASAFGNGQYVFLSGGHDGAGALLADTVRARVLGTDTVPVIAAPAAEEFAASALLPGTYSYRVSAVMDGTGDNPGGETLPSDAETIVIGTERRVAISWAAVPGATGYRVYRSPLPNSLAGTERRIAAPTGTSFTDDGTAVVGAEEPLPSGALGVWADQPDLAAGRANGVAVAAQATGGRTFVYVLGGVTGAPEAAVTDCELAEITSTAGVASIGAFSACGDLSVARGEHIGAVIDAASAPIVAGLATTYLAVAQGVDGGTVLSNIEVASVGDDGTLSAWTTYAGTPSQRRHGSSSALVNNVLFSLGGRDGSGGYQDRGLTADVCPSGTNCDTDDPPIVNWGAGDSGIVLSAARYRAGTVYVGGLFYFTGGRSNDTTVLASCEQGSYQ